MTANAGKPENYSFVISRSRVQISPSAPAFGWSRREIGIARELPAASMASGEAIDSGAPYVVRRQISPSALAFGWAAREICIARELPAASMASGKPSTPVRLTSRVVKSRFWTASRLREDRRIRDAGTPR